MTVSAMKRSVDDMQVDSDAFTAQAGTSIIQSVKECVKNNSQVCQYFNQIFVVFFSSVALNLLFILPKTPKLKPSPSSVPSIFP